MHTPKTAAALEKALKSLADPERAEAYLRFFKTGPGEYGEGDAFYGIRMPDIRETAKAFRELPLAEIRILLASPIHELRMCGSVILTLQYAKGDDKKRAEVFNFYIRHARRINNWDLVDVSAHKIVGAHLLNRDRTLLYRLAKSRNLWERRIAVVATAHFISKGDLDDTFRISEMLLADKHDLIHKACGWMLREAGKKDLKRLEAFLDRHVQDMPRTMLRYAIEKLPERKRKAYLNR